MAKGPYVNRDGIHSFGFMSLSPYSVVTDMHWQWKMQRWSQALGSSLIKVIEFRVYGFELGGTRFQCVRLRGARSIFLLNFEVNRILSKECVGVVNQLVRPGLTTTTGATESAGLIITDSAAELAAVAALAVPAAVVAAATKSETARK